MTPKQIAREIESGTPIGKSLLRDALRSPDLLTAPKLRTGQGYCSGCGEEITLAEAHWHDGQCYCDDCEDAPAAN